MRHSRFWIVLPHTWNTIRQDNEEAEATVKSLSLVFTIPEASLDGHLIEDEELPSRLQTANSVCNILLSAIDIYLKHKQVIQMQGNVWDNMMKSSGKNPRAAAAEFGVKKTKTNTFQGSWVICCKLNVRDKGKRTRKKLVQTITNSFQRPRNKTQQISEKDLQKNYFKI